MTAFETLAVGASESMQHQTFTEVIDAITVLLDRLRPDQQARAEDLILRIISALGEYVLTADLDAALAGLMAALTRSSRPGAAGAVRAARDELAASIGQLHSRSTRVGAAGDRRAGLSLGPAFRGDAVSGAPGIG